MQCQLCKKQATVHLTEIINGLKIEKHLCEHCARKEGITITTNMPVKELLSDLVNSQQQAQQVSQLSCDDCGMTFGQFRKGGLLGCPNDYQVFKEPLLKLIQKAHEGAAKHVGRVPHVNSSNIVPDQLKIMRLRRELEQSIEHEDYEAAAKIRDQIENL
ncbi:MAG: UvrB/UvrC motif-containing protein [Phycisphaerae bacterium]|nr:UvrB/UvrC motif-containing protein [Phycisphaerae bacterium]